MRTKKKRVRSLNIRLSDEENTMLRQKAKAAGISVSALLRDHITSVRIYNHKQRQHVYATLLSIRKQLTKLGEKAQAFSPVHQVVTIAYLNAISSQLEDVENREP
jgi:hypothetical protein